MSVLFWDVDTQHDFMHADGKLYVPGAESIIPNLQRLNGYAHQHGIQVIASADDHVAGHAELASQPDYQTTFPPHCLRGTPGQKKIPETALRNPLVVEPEPLDATLLAGKLRQHQGDILLHKHRFDVFTNSNVETVIETLRPRTIVLYGVATDVCNRYAIEGLIARHPEVRLFAVTDAMKAIDPDAQEHLLRQWAEEGVRMIQTDELVEDGIPA